MKTRPFIFSIIAILLLVGCATSPKVTQIGLMNLDIQQLADRATQTKYQDIVKDLDSKFENKKAQCKTVIETMDSKIKNSSNWLTGLTIGGGVAGGTGTVLLAISSANVAGAAIASGVAGVIALGQAFFKEGGLKDPVAYVKRRNELDEDIKKQIKKWDGPSTETDVEKRIKAGIANKQAIISELDAFCFSVPSQIESQGGTSGKPAQENGGS